MKSVDILVAEHKIILGNLREIEKLIPRLTTENIQMLTPYLEFLQGYADEQHHAREEKILFPWMLQRQPDLQQGPVGLLLKEHVQARAFVASVTQVVETLVVDASGVKKVQETLNLFLSLYHAHIAKEEDILYKIAEQIDAKTHDGDKCMFLEFAKLEREMGVRNGL